MLLGPRGCSPSIQNKRSLVTACFCGLIRGGEAATQKGKCWNKHFYPTRSDTVRYKSGARGVGIHMAKKTSIGAIQPGKNAIITLVRSRAALDPAAELDCLLAIDPVFGDARESTPLWRDTSTGLAITVCELRTLVKLLMKTIGLDPTNFGAHSLR